MVGARGPACPVRPGAPTGWPRTTSAPATRSPGPCTTACRGSSWCSTSIRTPPGGPVVHSPGGQPAEPYAPVTAGGWLRATGDPAAGLASLGVDLRRAPIRTAPAPAPVTAGPDPAPAAAPEGAAGDGGRARRGPAAGGPGGGGGGCRGGRGGPDPGSACGARRRLTRSRGGAVPTRLTWWSGRGPVTWTPTPTSSPPTRRGPAAGRGPGRVGRRRRGGPGRLRQGLVRPPRVPSGVRLPALAAADRGQRGPQPPAGRRAPGGHELRFATDRAVSAGADAVARGRGAGDRGPAVGGRRPRRPARGACGTWWRAGTCWSSTSGRRARCWACPGAR